MYDFKFKLKVINCKKNKKLTRTKLLDVYGISNGSLYNWYNQYEKNCLPQKIHKKSKVTTDIKCYIMRYIVSRINFNRHKLINLINKKYNIQISQSTLYKIISELNITKKKINKKIDYSKRIKKHQLIKNFKNQLKNIPLKDIISIDETSIDTHISNNYGWSLKGKKITVIKKEKRVRYTVLCAIDMNKIIHCKIINNSANGTIFIDFIKEMLNKIPKTHKKHILLDNARIHHSKMFKEYIKENEWINLLFNVPYSPEYNPIEKVFNEFKHNLKQMNINNNNIKNNINKSFNKISSEHLINYYNKSLN